MTVTSIISDIQKPSLGTFFSAGLPSVKVCELDAHGVHLSLILAAIKFPSLIT